MRKRDELADPNSCLNLAADDEMIFVLRGHDVAAAETIRFWAAGRVRLGKNIHSDNQIIGALQDADVMERERRERFHRMGSAIDTVAKGAN